MIAKNLNQGNPPSLLSPSPLFLRAREARRWTRSTFDRSSGIHFSPQRFQNRNLNFLFRQDSLVSCDHRPPLPFVLPLPSLYAQPQFSPRSHSPLTLSVRPSLKPSSKNLRVIDRLGTLDPTVNWRRNTPSSADTPQTSWVSEGAHENGRLLALRVFGRFPEVDGGWLVAKKEKFSWDSTQRKYHIADLMYDGHNDCFSKSPEFHRRDIITLHD